MKSYEVHRIQARFSRESTEELRKQTEDLLNKKAAIGLKHIKIDFELLDQSGYIYSFIVFEK